MGEQAKVVPLSRQLVIRPAVDGIEARLDLVNHNLDRIIRQTGRLIQLLEQDGGGASVPPGPAPTLTPVTRRRGR